MNPKDVVPFIEGEPLVGTVPVEPGLTNTIKEKDGGRVVGFNTENSEVKEGLVTFDIVFYVRLKDGTSQVIVNLEAQREVTNEYAILNRAIFYVSRLLSSQKGRDFEKTDYNSIKPVYSIWIVMNMKEANLTHVHLTKQRLMGTYD